MFLKTLLNIIPVDDTFPCKDVIICFTNQKQTKFFKHEKYIYNSRSAI